MFKNGCCFCFLLFVASVFSQFSDVNTNSKGTYCDSDPLGLLKQTLFVDPSDFVRVVIIK